MSEQMIQAARLLTIWRNNLKVYLRQREQLGLHVPAHISTQIDEIRAKVRNAVETYGFDSIPGIDYDEVSTVSLTLDRDTYDRIRAIVAQHGIELPEVE